ncbi:hypothetical protein ACEWY4_024397 [Coilia grayii]|uniref:RNA-binding motif, single-stranded-interacting protein 3 n=1 Tax=Coilia grayii TaxID=363190 RepID=A0ABD1J170_9TELE
MEDGGSLVWQHSVSSEVISCSTALTSYSSRWNIFSMTSCATEPSPPTEPLLCKFADGGQKKRQSQSKYPQNGRPWHREGETGMAITYDPTAMQNGFYSPPYSIATNRMIAQTSITPFIAASPVSTYQVQSTSWMPHQQYVMQPTGAVITPAMDHTMSMQPASMMGPLTQQMNHLSLGTTGSYMTAAAAAAPMQGTYIPQYTPVPPTAVPVEGVVTDASPQSVAPSSQEVGGQQQQMQVETAGDHVPTYSYQSNTSSLAFKIAFQPSVTISTQKKLGVAICSSSGFTLSQLRHISLFQTALRPAPAPLSRGYPPAHPPTCPHLWGDLCSMPALVSCHRHSHHRYTTGACCRRGCHQLPQSSVPSFYTVEQREVPEASTPVTDLT